MFRSRGGSQGYFVQGKLQSPKIIVFNRRQSGKFEPEQHGEWKKMEQNVDYEFE